MKELATLENITALEVFTSGNAETLVTKIEAEVRSFVPNLKTAKSRQEIASLSAKVSKSKALLETLGKDLVSDWKTKAKAVDVERRMIRERLDALRDEARKPLTDWETAEALKIEEQIVALRLLDAHEKAIVENDLFDRVKEIERKEAEQQEQEVARLAKEEGARIEIERQATEKRVEAERVAREKQIAKDAAAEAKREVIEAKEAAEQKVIEAKVAVQLAKKEAADAKIKAASDKKRAVKEAEDKAKRVAVQVEQKRKAEQARVDAAAAKKAANKRHRTMINNKVLAKLKALGMSDDLGKKLIVSIAKNEIDYLSIDY